MARQERKAGRSDLSIGPISYGCWRLAEGGLAEAAANIETALDCGMTLIDTADVYGAGQIGFGAAESLLGEVLKQAPSFRDEMILATKAGVDLKTPYDNTSAYLTKACDASLQRLGVDRIDVFYVHRPDLLTDPAEIAETLDALIAAGKTASVGLSNFPVARARAVSAHMRNEICFIQNEFSPLELAPLDDGALDWCAETGARFVAWSPLGGGRLAIGDPRDAREKAVLDRVDEIAEKLGASRAQTALAFLLTHPSGVVPVIGTQRPERIRTLADAASLRLERRDWYRILEANYGRNMP